MADQKQALASHNNARSSAPGVKRPALDWDDGLASAAQSYAQHLAQTNRFQHSGTAGENLFMSSGHATFTNASDDWIGERPNYHGETIADGKFASYGHYTQVIWPTTTKVGLGSAKASNGSTYIVGRYSPAGNWMGQSAYGSAPPTSGKAPEKYTITAGDGMWLISQKFRITLDALKAANPQVTPPHYSVTVGQVLNIPVGSQEQQKTVTDKELLDHPNGAANGVHTVEMKAPAPKNGWTKDEKVSIMAKDTKTYTVVAGDSMWLVAQKVHLSLTALEAANPQVAGPAYALKLGEVLHLPGAGSPPTGPSGGGNSGGGDPGTQGNPTVHAYSGPPSNFPEPSQWQKFSLMSTREAITMNKTNNTHQETQYVLDAVETVSRETGIDKRGILAVIMQESQGKVRVNSTSSPGAGINNTGLMQAHNGVSFDPNNPRGSITQMVRDGAAGVPGPAGGDGLQQLVHRYGNFFVACRGYNSGDGGIHMQNLSDGGGATSSYVSDIANRLMGADPN